MLPDELKNENIIGIAFADENGNVEFYNIHQSGSLLGVTLPHLSKYYIIVENTVDLSPLIIFLIILLVFEAVALCFFIYLRRNRKRKEMYMLPDSFLHGINPFLVFSALRVKPENAVELTLLLSVAALALGCGIAFLAKAELGALKKQQRKEQKPQTMSVKEQDKLEEKERLLLKEKTYLLESKKRQPVYCSVGAHPETESFNSFAEEEEAPQKNEQVASDITALYRAEINLDIIAKKFAFGELVTPEALKRKHLIPQKADYVKILARGKLNKPLLIEAHDFSRSAEEMLKAVGGEAIRIK